MVTGSSGGIDVEDEAALVARARERDQVAFEQLVAAYRQRTWSVCYQICGNPQDAEDDLQDALVSAWQHLGRFRGEARFGTWLHRIAANAALGVVRRRRDVLVEDLETLGSPPLAAFDAYDQVLEADRIEAALRHVPIDFRVALVLREYGDLTYEEIGRHQGVPVQTVKSRINRARTALREQLGA